MVARLAGVLVVSVVQEMLARTINEGSITLIWPNGKAETVNGDAAPHVSVCIHKHSYKWKLALHPSYYFPEGFVKGDITIAEGDLRLLLTLLMKRTCDTEQPSIGARANAFVQPLTDLVSCTSSRRNAAKAVQYHYDLSNEFFSSSS